MLERMAYLKRETGSHGSHPCGLFVLFPSHHTAGFPEKAVAHYQQAIQLSPSHHVAVVNLGRLYRSLGENSKAEEWYRRYSPSPPLSWPSEAISSFHRHLSSWNRQALRTDRLSEQEHMLPTQVTEWHGSVVMCWATVLMGLGGIYLP